MFHHHCLKMIAHNCDDLDIGQKIITLPKGLILISRSDDPVRMRKQQVRHLTEERAILAWIPKSNELPLFEHGQLPFLHQLAEMRRMRADYNQAVLLIHGNEPEDVLREVINDNIELWNNQGGVARFILGDIGLSLLATEKRMKEGNYPLERDFLKWDK